METFDAHPANALGTGETNGAGRLGSQVDDAAPDIRTSIIHSHDDPPAVVQIGASDEAAERPVTVRGGEGGGAETFPAGGAPVRVKRGQAVLCLDNSGATFLGGGLRRGASREKHP